jgi:hypothetical protein
VGNTHEIQNGRNPVRNWFIPVATKVKPDIAKGSTAQGKYVVAADGTAYGFNNNRSVERVHQMLDRALAEFKAHPPTQVTIPDEELKAKWVPEPPTGSAVVRLFTRIKPAPLGSDSANENVARDYFWILPEEQAALAKGEVPESFKMRLARFTLVDNVRGEPDHWRTAEIQKLDLKISPVGKDKFKLTGSFSLQTPDNARGYQGTLDCEMAFTGNALKTFQAFAEGKAWGRSTYTPDPPAGKFPLLIGYQLASEESAKDIAPQAVFYGREYLTGK